MASPRHRILLTEELKLPARTSRDVFNACSPRFDLVDRDLRELREDLSSVRGGGVQQKKPAKKKKKTGAKKG